MLIRIRQNDADPTQSGFSTPLCFTCNPYIRSTVFRIIWISVADRGFGIWGFLTSEFGIRNKFFFLIPDPTKSFVSIFWLNNNSAVSSNLFLYLFKNLNNLQFCEFYVHLLVGLVILKLEWFLFYSINSWWIRERKKPGSGKNITDPQHWFECLLSAKRIIFIMRRSEAKLSCNGTCVLGVQSVTFCRSYTSSWPIFEFMTVLF